MAMEYFKEHIEPTLPEITFFGAEFLDFTTPFTSECLDGPTGMVKIDKFLKDVEVTWKVGNRFSYIIA